MKLSECLLQRDIQDLKQIARSFAWQGNFHSKMELIQAVHMRLLQPETVQKIIRNMTDRQRQMWTIICFYPQHMYRKSELRRLARIQYPELSHTEWDEWLSHLLQLGYLQPVNMRHEERLQLPEDVRSQLQTQLAQYWQTSFHLPSTVRVDDPSTHSFDLDTLHDMFQFLCFLTEEPAPLTVDGVMYKPVQRALFETFRIRENILEQTRWRFGYGRRFPHYPNRFSLIYDYCYQQGWIHERDQLVVIDPRVETFRYGDIVNRKRQADLVQFWMAQYSKAIPLLPMILSFCSVVTKKSVHHIDDFKRLCEPWVRPFYFDTIDQMIMTRIFQMGIFLGVFSWAGRDHHEYDKIKINALSD